MNRVFMRVRVLLKVRRMGVGVGVGIRSGVGLLGGLRGFGVCVLGIRNGGLEWI